MRARSHPAGGTYLTMLYPLDDTIAAIASPPGGAARGIVRISGPQTLDCLGRVFHPDDGRELSTIAAPAVVQGQVLLDERIPGLPCDLYLWPNRHSYTGQPSAEIHTLGSPPLLEATLRGLAAAGARVAQPGEFTLRAFLSGRLDLTQAEAVLGVIDAADRRQLDVALAQLAGGLASPLGKLRDDLVDLLARLEAGFDFPDEDISFISADQIDRRLAAAAATIEALTRQMACRAEAADRVRLVLVGRPNTGKSSLFNRLAAGASALVADQPGTTRDYLTAQIDLDGLKCLLVDTAGQESESVDPRATIRQAAQAAAAEQSRQADVEILCLEATRPLDNWELGRLADRSPTRVVVLTKADVGAVGSWELGVGSGECRTGFQARPDAVGWAKAVEWAERSESHQSPAPIVAERSESHQPPHQSPANPLIPTSSLTGEGLDLLRVRLREAALEAMATGSDVVAGTAVRCRESLRLAAELLQRGRRLIASGEGEELLAAEVRVALDELGKVVGAVYTDDILDCIFSRFCIGK